MLDINNMIQEGLTCPRKRFFILLSSMIGRVQCDVIPSGYLLTLKDERGVSLSSTIRGTDSWNGVQELLAERLGVKIVSDKNQILSVLNEGFSGVEAGTSTLRCMGGTSKELWERK